MSQRVSGNGIGVAADLTGVSLVALLGAGGLFLLGQVRKVVLPESRLTVASAAGLALVGDGA